MKILLNWINEYVKISDFSLEQVSKALVEIGFEVESATYLGESVKGVKTCKILSAVRISEKLKLCSVSFGKGETVNVVCGAPNAAEGMITAYASIGAIIKGKTIQVADFHGTKSEGMLCSAGELNLGAENFDFPINADGILNFPHDTKLGEDLDKLLFLDDYILDVSITANRPDCQSIYGLARELAVKFNRKLNPLELDYKTSGYNGEFMPKITVGEKDLCPLYIGSRIKNVVVGNSPKWMRARLTALGHKPINNIVDITNYVLLEVGQPLHAFDLENIEKEIIVRLSGKNERIKTLDGADRALDYNLVIADKGKPLAIAGVMGGEFSGIKSGTTEVFLESARFARGHIRLGARSLGISTDSSKRYEKGVDFDSVEIGRMRALSLIDQLKAGKIVDITVSDGDNQLKERSKSKTIFLDSKLLESLLGIKIPSTFIKNTLTALSFGMKQRENGLEVTVPLFREDVDNYTDLAEEIIRFYGYDKLNAEPVDNLPMSKGGITKERAVINRIERVCTAQGLCEVKNFSFIPPLEYKKLLIENQEQIKLINPLSEEYSAMRTQLLSSVLNTAALNINRKNQNFRIFEIDNVFLPIKNQLPLEKKSLCAVFCNQNEDFFSVKSFISALTAEFKISFDVEKTEKPYFHPNLSANIIVNGKCFGSFGKIHPLAAKNFGLEKDIYAAIIDVSALFDFVEQPIKFKPLPKYPSVERDLAIVVDENVSVGQIFESIKSSMAKDIICLTDLIEVYCGEQVESGKKSVLVRLNLTNKEKTMTEGEISTVVSAAIDGLKQKFNARLRQ